MERFPEEHLVYDSNFTPLDAEYYKDRTCQAQFRHLCDAQEYAQKESKDWDTMYFVVESCRIRWVYHSAFGDEPLVLHVGPSWPY